MVLGMLLSNTLHAQLFHDVESYHVLLLSLPGTT